MRRAWWLLVGLFLVAGSAGCPIPERRPPIPLPAPDLDPENPPFGSTVVTQHR